MRPALLTSLLGLGPAALAAEPPRYGTPETSLRQRLAVAQPSTSGRRSPSSPSYAGRIADAEGAKGAAHHRAPRAAAARGRQHGVGRPPGAGLRPERHHPPRRHPLPVDLPLHRAGGRHRGPAAAAHRAPGGRGGGGGGRRGEHHRPGGAGAGDAGRGGLPGPVRQPAGGGPPGPRPPGHPRLRRAGAGAVCGPGLRGGPLHPGSLHGGRRRGLRRAARGPGRALRRPVDRPPRRAPGRRPSATGKARPAGHDGGLPSPSPGRVGGTSSRRGGAPPQAGPTSRAAGRAEDEDGIEETVLGSAARSTTTQRPPRSSAS